MFQFLYSLSQPLPKNVIIFIISSSLSLELITSSPHSILIIVYCSSIILHTLDSEFEFIIIFVFSFHARLAFPQHHHNTNFVWSGCCNCHRPSGSSFKLVIGPRGWFRSWPIMWAPSMPAPSTVPRVWFHLRPHSSVSSVGQGVAEGKPGTESSDRSLEKLLSHKLKMFAIGFNARREWYKFGTTHATWHLS